MKFQDRLQRDMTAEVELDETPCSIAKELLELGLIHQVFFFLKEYSPYINIILVKIMITYIIVKSQKHCCSFSIGNVKDKFSSLIWRVKSKTKGYFSFIGDSFERINILLSSFEFLDFKIKNKILIISG